MAILEDLLRQLTAFHQHLCPRQVLGVRMGLLAGRLLGLNVPCNNKRLLTLVETDGCAADGVSMATGCRVGNRTLRVIDFGKVAATFVDILNGHAVRIIPSPLSRERAWDYASDAENKWKAQLVGYQHLPDNELLIVQHVEITESLEKLLSKPGYRVKCQQCGEEIINEREVTQSGMVLCRACAGSSYYQLVLIDNKTFEQ